VLHPKPVAVLFVLLLAGCGGVRNEVAALGLANPPAPEAPPALSAEQALAQAREAAAKGDWDTADPLYTQAAEGGSTQAQLELGTMYLSGTGFTRDLAAAEHWLEPPAKAGIAAAQVRLGMIYEIGGNGVMQDNAKAMAWYERAAAKGDAAAQYRAGELVLTQILGREEPERAAEFFRAAAAQGFPQAETALGLLYIQGRGEPLDIGTGLAWLHKGAAGNDPDAMFELGHLMWEGDKVPKNIPEGTMWLQKAAALGSDDARHELALPPT
jgi:TPR repeat protein